MIAAVISALFAAILSAPASAFEKWDQRIDLPDHDIVIVHTNDVHCGVDDNIGYAGLAAFRDEMMKQTPYVALVDCGDFVQGDVLGTMTSGDCIIDIMNALGYDVAVPGNHEFDYGIPRLAELIDKSNAQIVGANIRWLGGGHSPLNKIKPYKIMTFGPTKVAFVGVLTPTTTTTSTPRHFMRDGEFVWTFRGDSPKDFYRDIQDAVVECRISGADFVILVTHVGNSEFFGPFASPVIARETWGVDAIIDGHEHNILPSIYERSKTGDLVPITSTGTKLQTIGRVVITKEGHVASGVINGWSERDEAIERKIAEIRQDLDAVLSQVVASSNASVSDSADGARAVRCRESALGDMITDALCAAGGADVAMINGGAIRAPIPAGDIKISDLLTVMPFGTSLFVVNAKGQDIIDALEWGAQSTQRQSRDGSLAVGEFGGFLQVSGLKYTIDTSVASSVTSDKNGLFAGVAGARRVSDVQIRRASGWEPIDPNGSYKVAGLSYLIQDSGDGNTAFKDCEVLIGNGTADYMVLTEYIRDVLRGDLTRYGATDGRITVK